MRLDTVILVAFLHTDDYQCHFLSDVLWKLSVCSLMSEELIKWGGVVVSAIVDLSFFGGGAW